MNVAEIVTFPAGITNVTVFPSTDLAISKSPFLIVRLSRPYVASGFTVNVIWSPTFAVVLSGTIEPFSDGFTVIE